MDRPIMRKGECVFIHNHSYRAPNCCFGFEDAKKLRSLFRDDLQINLHYLRDLSVNEMFHKLKRVKASFQQEVDLFFLIVFSHVKARNVQLVDNGEIPIAEIIDLFNEENCPNLADKPKVVLIKSCYEDNATPYIRICPIKKQFLIIEAPMPKKLSRRFYSEESPFINSLVEVVRVERYRTDFYHMIPLIIETERRNNRHKKEVPVAMFQSTICYMMPLMM